MARVVYILRDCSLFSIPRCHLVFVGCSVSSNYSCNGQLNLQKQLDIKILIPLTPLSNNNCCYCGWIALPWSPDLRSFKSVVTTVKYSRWLHIHCINISSPLIKHIKLTFKSQLVVPSIVEAVISVWKGSYRLLPVWMGYRLLPV